MTKPIDVTINNKVFEVSIVIKDDKGQRVRLPKNFFKNADPANFVDLSQNLLKAFDKRSQITWVDGKGVVYKKNPDNPEDLSDKQKVEWDKVEAYVLKRFSSLPPEAFNDDEEEVATELDDALPVATGTSPAPRSSAPNTTGAPIISGRPEVGLGVEDDGIVTTPAQTVQRAPDLTTRRLAQDTDTDDQTDPLVTVPPILAPMNHNAALTQAQLLEAQANAALAQLNQEVAALNLSQATGTTQVPATSTSQTPITTPQTPVTAPTTPIVLHSTSAPARTPAPHYMGPATPDIRTPGYPEAVHEVVDTFLDWVLRKLRT